MYIIKKMSEFGSKNFGIYHNGSLIEGGFFSRDAALNAMREYASA